MCLRVCVCFAHPAYFPPLVCVTTTATTLAFTPDLSKADRKVAVMIDECRQQLAPRPFSTTQPVYTDKITVCVRKRPTNKKERDGGEIDCITAPDGQLTVVHEAKEKVDLTKYIENHEVWTQKGVCVRVCVRACVCAQALDQTHALSPILLFLAVSVRLFV